MTHGDAFTLAFVAGIGFAISAIVVTTMADWVRDSHEARRRLRDGRNRR